MKQSISFNRESPKRWRWLTRFILLFLFIPVIPAAGQISVSIKQQTIKQALRTIEDKSDYKFVYRSDIPELNKVISFESVNETIDKVLSKILSGTQIAYEKKTDNQIVIFKRNANPAKQPNSGRKISGIVVDQKGEPIIGANIAVSGTSLRAITSFNGHFSIPAQKGQIITVSYIGYSPREITITDQTDYSISMNENMTGLNEVVVVGYGTMRKADITGSTTQIKPEALKTTISGNALESLQGKASGIAVFNNNKPGEAPAIRIRGSGSISSSNEPLYVVDGFPLMDSNIGDINANDIESMEILKDASSTAIYGSRGANGVVLITTKKGTQNANNLTFNSSVGIQTPGRLLNLISGSNFVDFMNAGYLNQGSAAPFPNAPDTYKANTNWEKEILQKSALLHNYNLTFDGSSKGTKYMLSSGYFNQEGLVAAQGFEKYSLHMNVEHQFSKWLNAGTNSQFTYSIQNVYDEGLTDVSRYGWATEPVYNADRSYNIASTHNTYVNYPWNPVMDISQETNKTTNNRYLTNVYFEIRFMDDLKLRTNVGIDLKNLRNYQFKTSQTANNIALNRKGEGSNTWAKNMSRIIENMLTYSHNWNKHKLTATGVYSWQNYTFENASISGSGFENDQTGAWDMSLADKSSVAWATTKYDNKLISFTGRVTYGYNNKYLLTATNRWDGSSRFGKTNKWGYFPSLGIGWRITQEPFLRDNKVITDLKLRTSYGITGNQEIGNYSSLAQLISADYTNSTDIIKGFAESMGNKDLKWERTSQWDWGFDLNLFNQINVNVDYYKRHTNNLLYNVPIPSTSGYSTVLSNVGAVSNHGVEINVGGTILNQKDFKITASVNATYNENRIDKLYGDVSEVAIRYESSGLARVLKVGNPVDAIYARKSLGIIKTQAQLDAYKKNVPNTASNAKLGDEMYADILKDGTISSADYISLGSVQPKYFYGINTGIEYKKVSINIYGQGGFNYASVAGAEDYYANGSAWAMSYANLGSYMLYGENQVLNNVYIPTGYAYKRMWSTKNPNGDYPAAGAHGIYLSDRTNANWNYFIVKNIQCNYDLTSALKSRFIKKIVVSLNFQNFITLANHRGYNPINGDISNPWYKSVFFGLNASF